MNEIIKLLSIMESKKTKKADLERRRLYHFTIGLVLTVSTVFVAFEWKYKERTLINFEVVAEEFPEAIEMPVTEIKPPEPPKVQPVIIPVDDDEEVDVTIDFIIDVEIDDPIPDMAEMDEPEVEETDKIHIVVEEQPSFPGGEKAFYQYVASKMKYPKLAVRQGIDGRVFVQFVVNQDGSLTDIQVIKGIGGGCDEEAVRVLESAPRWNPGKQRGKPVRVRMVLPIIFQLQ